MNNIFLAEFVGTFMMILLGDGVVANVSLNKSGQKGAGSIQITLAWGLAVMVPAIIFGPASGGHFNPAVTIANYLAGNVKGGDLGKYICGQFLGAFCGAVMVYILFKDMFDATSDNPEGCRGVFCTAPSVPNTGLNFLSELVGTWVLVFALMGFGNVAEAAGAGVNYLFVNGLIVSIGMSLGGLTGYAINPARDFGPRLAYAILPFKNKAKPNWEYGWIPVIAPIIGGCLGYWTYAAMFL